MKNGSSYLFTALACLISGCAPDLGLRIAPPEVPSLQEEKKAAETKPLAGIRVKVAPFSDGRGSDALAVIDGRNVGAEGSVGSSVQAGFERQIREAGGRIAIVDASVIEGEVADWRANVKPSFPMSEVVANAKVMITVKGADSKVIYRGTYGGEARKQDPFLSERDVRDALGDAMARAISAAVSDKVMAQQLSTTTRVR
jgi:hypothetical protein